MATLVERLEQLMRRDGIKNPAELARRLEEQGTPVSRQQPWKWLNKKQEIPDARIKDLAKLFRVDEQWLRFGGETDQMASNQLAKVIEMVEQICAEKHIDLTPKKKADLITLLYEEAIRNQVVDQTFISRLLNIWPTK